MRASPHLDIATKVLVQPRTIGLLAEMSRLMRVTNKDWHFPMSLWLFG